MTEHLMIPDNQAKPGVPMHHLAAAGRLIVDRRPDHVIIIGDAWDFPSLNTHTSSAKIHYEHRHYIDDYGAGCHALDILLYPLRRLQRRQAKNKKKIYQPGIWFTMGNHEFRANRLLEQEPILQGSLPLPEDYLRRHGIKHYPYKVPVVIDGIRYCHLCPQTKSAGAVERAHLIVAKRHQSWTVGHSQGLDYFVSPHEPRIQALIAGAFYLHNEDYKEGSNDHWRGLVYKRNVRDGQYTPEFIDMHTLLQEYGDD